MGWLLLILVLLGFIFGVAFFGPPTERKGGE